MCSFQQVFSGKECVVLLQSRVRQSFIVTFSHEEYDDGSNYDDNEHAAKYSGEEFHGISIHIFNSNGIDWRNIRKTSIVTEVASTTFDKINTESGCCIAFLMTITGDALGAIKW